MYWTHPMETPMNVVCRIVRMPYRVVYERVGESACLPLSGRERVQEGSSANVASMRVAFIQYKVESAGADTRRFRIRVSYYALPSNAPLATYLHKEHYTQWDTLLKHISDTPDVHYVIKNLRRASILMNNANDTSAQKLPRLYCFDTFVKYHVKLPLYVYGRISKRFRIPTADEFYSSDFATLTPKPADYAVHREHGQIRTVFVRIAPNLADIIQDSESSVLRIVKYYFLTGYEVSQIAYLYSTLRERKKVSDECEYLIHYLPKHTKSVESRYECIIEGEDTPN